MEIFETGANPLVRVAYKRVEAGRAMVDVDRVVALAALARVATDREDDRLDRVNVDPAFEIDRVGVPRERLVAVTVDCRDLVIDEALSEAAEDVDSPVGRRAELGAVGERILDETVAV